MSTLKSLRSRLLMPMTSASTSSAGSSSSSSWTSTITSRSSARASASRSRQLVGLERRDDQQDRVGAGRRGLVDLVAVDDEVLAQDRQRRGRARLAQVVERAAEVGRLGQHRERRGAAALVGAGRCRRPRTPARIRRPTASGACARRSPRCPGAVERLGERPRPPGGARAAPRAAASETSRGGARPRRASPRRSGRDAHATGASSPVSATSASSARAAAPVVDRRLGGAHALLERVRRGPRRRSPRRR